MQQSNENFQNRFEFGKNWRNFIENLTEENILEAEESIKQFLGLTELSKLNFLDIGSGSGLLSLAARRLGAKVLAFDYDHESVLCTQELKNRYAPNDPNWVIMQGSILDKEFVSGLGKFDISYAWGVLHHTGALWQALYNANLSVKVGGLLFLGIYNDQGLISECWKGVKAFYCSGNFGKIILTLIFYPFFFISGLMIDLVKLRNPRKRYRDHKKYRGMSLLTDWRDWLGGFPYEPASSTEIIGYFQNLGYELLRFQKTGHGFGNNQFLFRKLT